MSGRGVDIRDFLAGKREGEKQGADAERARLREKVEAMLKRDIRPPIAKDGFDLAIRDVLEILGEP